MDLPLPVQHREDAERQDLAAHVLERDVEVRQRQREGNRLARALGEDDHLGIDHGLELLRHVLDLGLGHRHEAPVLLPRRVVDLADEVDFLLEALHVHRARDDRLALADQLDAAHQPLGRVVVVDPVGEQVLALPESRALVERAVIGRVVRHHDRRRRREAVDQGAAIVVGREVHRPAQRVLPARAHPFPGAVEQGRSRLEIVLALEEAEEADLVAVELVVRAVVDRRDAPDHAAVPEGEERLDLGVLEERVLRRG
jgi:hypothetical protein